MGLIFWREGVSSFQESIGPVQIKHDVMFLSGVYEWEGLCGVQVAKGVDSVR